MKTRRAKPSGAEGGTAHESTLPGIREPLAPDFPPISAEEPSTRFFSTFQTGSGYSPPRRCCCPRAAYASPKHLVFCQNHTLSMIRASGKIAFPVGCFINRSFEIQRQKRKNVHRKFPWTVQGGSSGWLVVAMADIKNTQDNSVEMLAALMLGK